MNSSCQRVIRSCARCRRRKIKCDRRLPSCSPCQRNGKPCTGVSQSADELPRSFLFSLEQQIAQLEADLARRRRLDDVNAPEPRLESSPVVQDVCEQDESYGPGSQPGDEIENAARPATTQSAMLDNNELSRVEILSSSVMQSLVSAYMPSVSGATDLLMRVRLVQASLLLLSEMTQIHFQGEPLPQQLDWDGWLTDMERRLRQWHSQSLNTTGLVESPDFALSRGLMILHRPSPRVPRPSEASLLVSFEAACTAAGAYREQIASGSLRRLWISAHYTLEAAMVVLFCLRHGCGAIRAKFAPHSVLDMTKVLTVNFILIAGQGWPEVSAYAGIYERLLGTLLEPVLSPTAVSCFSPAQDAELLRLLYPSPAQLEKLRLGHDIHQEQGGWQPDFEIWDTSWQLFDFESLAEPTFDHEIGIYDSSQWTLPDNTEALDFGSTFTACEKADQDCDFIDDASGQAISRSHIQSLLARLERLQTAAKQSSNSATNNHPTNGSFSSEPIETILPDPISNQPPSDSGHFSFDVIIPFMAPEPKTRYWGASSVFAPVVQILQHASLKKLSKPMDAFSESCRPDPPDIDILDREMAPAPEADVSQLVSFYMRTLNTIYVLVDETTIFDDLRDYLEVRSRVKFSSRTLKSDTAHRFFRISLMCAAACATQARHRPSRIAESLAYYKDALGCVEEVTSEASPASLQALLLLIIFCLFYPRKGEIWRLLDYACRLALELGYHKDDLHAQNTSVENEMASAIPPANIATSNLHRQPRHLTFWALYALERIMGQMFGRASDLPESIITVSYPTACTPEMPTVSSGPSLQASNMPFAPCRNSANSGVCQGNLAEGGALQDTEQTHLQAVAVVHHYRLVYLRSMIYRAMYVPSVTPAFVMEAPWLCEQYAAIRAWRRDLVVSDDFAGFSTITCVQGYNQTICFLFQPLLLQALRSTQLESSGLDSGATTQGQTRPGDVSPEECIIVADSFWAACELLHAYQRLIRAHDGSLLGSYPLTFLSAQYMWLAASTLVGHVLIALDGRVRKVWCFRRWHEEGTPVEGVEPHQTPQQILDYGSFIDMSPVCLMLLRWCADRWPGMSSLLDVYTELFQRLNKELIKRGMAA
ncbi:Fungal specific transcription factor domain-containing protein [Cladophialophora immunda]|nr:Fungal specific transcription factor domain-containing protein [Cladophialophora immunda]